MRPVPAKIIHIYGVVQGVGFRPFVSRLAARLGLTGSVANLGAFVEIHLQGTPENMERFLRLLPEEAPERAAIREIAVEDTAEEPVSTFEIVASAQHISDILIPPDIATCPRCEAELYDKKDRRYLHPFINCTDCGPRLTILDETPYDRERTSMKVFPMCGECSTEYHSPASRRFDAQPVCCNHCGPEVYLIDRPERGMAAIRAAREAIMAGKIIAVKGIGGFHLACDGRNAGAVQKLRERKHRPHKPFALMMKDLQTVREWCITTPEQEKILTGHRKPAVLLPRRPDRTLPEELAPGNPTLGVMLPYAPVQMLLFRSDDDLDQTMTDVLVMTSGNVSGAPIVRSDEDALNEIAGFCDLMLSHNRLIRLRADDSVTDFFRNEPYMIRRSRGYAPLPVIRKNGSPGKVLGIGGELKNTFCLAKNAYYYLSPYIGDMADLRTSAALEEAEKRMETLLAFQPEMIACDLHPQYFTTRFAESSGLPMVQIQHHWAHILSCMAENDWHSGPVIGISFDGTGYGTDGTIWGGEILHCSWQDFTRLGSIAPFVQAGGDASSREGWRIAGALLRDMDAPNAVETAARLNLCTPQEMQILSVMLEKNINCISSTSAGRLFDAASAILGLVTRSSFEGQAAMSLQFAAMKHTGNIPELCSPEELLDSGEIFRLKTDLLMQSLVRAKLENQPIPALARAFHNTLAEMILAACKEARERTGTAVCALSGGVFQNILLLEEVTSRLERAGFTVLRHHLVPPNDGGIALGQAAAAMEMMKQKKYQ
ncbi:MAG: carbamoyltransferase HypF [Lentisphaeria bacterium]|nr:carbamoyltransferase HypF [Lentisphaeria bacterium]